VVGRGFGYEQQHLVDGGRVDRARPASFNWVSPHSEQFTLQPIIRSTLEEYLQGVFQSGGESGGAGEAIFGAISAQVVDSTIDGKRF
jgi:hypothetical protein